MQLSAFLFHLYQSFLHDVCACVRVCVHVYLGFNFWVFCYFLLSGLPGFDVNGAADIIFLYFLSSENSIFKTVPRVTRQFTDKPNNGQSTRWSGQTASFVDWSLISSEIFAICPECDGNFGVTVQISSTTPDLLLI